MILVDTSVWVDHLRHGNSLLSEQLQSGTVLCHPLIVAELSLGTLKSREDVLSLLADLPTGVTASTAEVRHIIEERQLYGRGVGVIDVHLVACCLMTSGTSLWTREKRLNAVAADLRIPLVKTQN